MVELNEMKSVIMSYALARQRAEPLLFTGDGFSRTDVRAALSPI